jgi:hypothetical protein
MFAIEEVQVRIAQLETDLNDANLSKSQRKKLKKKR